MGVLAWLPFCNEVRHTVPEQPLKFRDKEQQGSMTMLELIEKYVPEFQDRATQLFHPVLPTGHLQTIFASLRNFETVDVVYYERMMLSYHDGGVGALDFATSAASLEHFQDLPNEVPPHQHRALTDRYRYLTAKEIDELASNDAKPMLIVMHGLTGGSDEGYVRAIVNRARDVYGFEACVLNSRGCAQSSITTPSLYNGAWTDDIRHCVKVLRGMYPQRKFYLVGVSLGASMATNYLGQEQNSSDIECAAVLGNPWDLTSGAYNLSKGLLSRYVYSPALRKNCVQVLKSNIRQLRLDPYMKKQYDEKLNSLQTIEDFDNEFTAKMFGFNTSYEYYRHASSVNRLPQVRTPLLAINALDDPIVGSEALPRREVAINPYVVLLETSKGGHIGWFDYKGSRWYVDPLCRFFYAFHREITKKNMIPDLDGVVLPHPHKFEKDRLVNPLVREWDTGRQGSS
ncbi:ACR149Cp [Eremothecium gossypii ATCC 10895]|uniref:ACR149Cp n=1 Tax=Eremothecium gossypii (strain ATCC 10895 / CBS 109.51 / FGSC 9923 / NRRL Y-1056) TaxID=284811 RepID=Q75BX2_EREGS|nr:ACR149Cp [Eremothecium gossypii ATCC 10895]AAS51375.1 ACR149Cp [Eremothecium gossypii ATCC 10895]AEY95666.1 FACR149Cp [Eremothecium gossypii FDAG1]